MSTKDVEGQQHEKVLHAAETLARPEADEIYEKVSAPKAQGVEHMQRLISLMHRPRSE